MARISQGIRKQQSCVCMCVCVHTCTCVAVFLRPLIEENLPFSPLRSGFLPTNIRLRGHWRGVILPRRPQSETPGVGSGRHQAKGKINAGEGSWCLPAWRVYYYSLRRRNVQALLYGRNRACPVPPLSSFLFSIPLPPFPTSPSKTHSNCQQPVTCSACEERGLIPSG